MHPRYGFELYYVFKIIGVYTSDHAVHAYQFSFELNGPFQQENLSIKLLIYMEETVGS
jgi:hypothetical protein